MTVAPNSIEHDLLFRNQYWCIFISHLSSLEESFNLMKISKPTGKYKKDTTKLYILFLIETVKIIFISATKQLH